MRGSLRGATRHQGAGGQTDAPRATTYLSRHVLETKLSIILLLFTLLLFSRSSVVVENREVSQIEKR